MLMKPSQRQGSSSEAEGQPGDTYFSGVSYKDGVWKLEVTELHVSARISRGEYNRNQVYGHVKASPAVPLVIEFRAENTLEGLRHVLESLQSLVTDVVCSKADEFSESLAREVSVKTPVRTIEAVEPGVRPGLSAVGQEPTEEDF